MIKVFKVKTTDLVALRRNGCASSPPTHLIVLLSPDPAFISRPAWCKTRNTVT